MKVYAIFWFESYYNIVGKENYELIKANIKKLRKQYTRDHFALYRFMMEHGIQQHSVTFKPRKTLKRV